MNEYIYIYRNENFFALCYFFNLFSRFIELGPNLNFIRAHTCNPIKKSAYKPSLATKSTANQNIE